VANYIIYGCVVQLEAELGVQGVGSSHCHM